jgi:hypothetical protein
MWLATACSSALAAPPDKRKPIIEKGGEQVSRGIIHESLETLDTPESRARLGRILNSQEVRDAVHDLSESFVMGIRDGVGRRVIGAALATSLTDENIERIGALGEQSTQAAVRGFAVGVEQDLGPALAATIDKDIGPALAIVIERDLLPAIARGFETPEMQHAVSTLARSLATEVVTGAGEAISDEDQRRTLTLFGSTIALGYAIALFAAFALGTMSIVLTILLVRNARRLRKLTEGTADQLTARP